MTAPDHPRSPPAVLLFDDRCGFCNDAVQFVLRHERQRSLCFASLHGEYGVELRTRHPELNLIDSMVWLRPSDGDAANVIAIRSDAALLTAEYLGGLFSLAAIARVLPRRLRDARYDLIARHRHKLSPAPMECLIPTPDQRSRFFD